MRSSSLPQPKITSYTPVYSSLVLVYMRESQSPQQAIGCQKEIKKTLGMTSKTHAYLKFEMTSYVKCQIDL